MAVAADRVPPSLASAPVVSLDDGTIRLEFDEYIDASRIGGSGVAVSVFANGSVPLPTGGGLPAAAGQADGTLVVLDMTDALEDAAYNAHGNGSTFSLGVPGAAFYDLSGNAFAGAANQTARATANQSALALASDPRLDLGSGELVFEFNRNVSAPAPSSLSDIAVAGAADGAARTNMSGLPVDHAGGDGVDPADGRPKGRAVRRQRHVRRPDSVGRARRVRRRPPPYLCRAGQCDP